MGRALRGAAGGSGAVFLLLRWAPAGGRAVPLPGGGGSRCAAGTCLSAVSRVLPAAVSPRPAGTGRDEPRERGREAAWSPRPSLTPAASGPGAPGGGGEGSARSGITCDSPCTARSSAICKYFCIFLLDFALPLRFPRAPALAGGRTVRSRAPRCAEIRRGSATPSRSLCCVFSPCLSASVCVRTCSSTLAS